MQPATSDPEALLRRGLESGRIHSAYLLSGPGDAPRRAALRFARSLVCEAGGGVPCESCRACRLSAVREEIRLDGAGRQGPLYRHVGEHPDLLWVERGADDTRVRIGQIRALQAALRLKTHAGGRRAAVVANAEWLNQEAQNALLRLLEEPPEATTLVLVTASSAGLLATVRSRCQRVAFRPAAASSLSSADAPEPVRAILERLARLDRLSIPDLLDWAEECRGERAAAAAATGTLLETASAWLHARVVREIGSRQHALRRELDAFRELQACRKSLAQRNANPQMLAERALFALRQVVAP